MEGHKRVEEELRNEISPERELLAAVLARAKADLNLRYTEISSGNTDEWRILSAQQIRTGAAFWINSDNPRPFGFVWTCEHLGLDPVKTRDKMLVHYENN